MASNGLPVAEKVRMAICMKASQHLGAKAGHEIYKNLQIETTVDHASFSEVVRVRYAQAAMNWSFPMGDERSVGSARLSEGVKQIVDEMLPLVCIAYAAELDPQQTIEVRL